MNPNIFVIVVLCCKEFISAAQSIEHDPVNYELPCPLEWDSAPCVCSGHSKAPNIDCSSAEKDYQLTTIFASLKDGLAFVEFTVHQSSLMSFPDNPFATSNFTKFTIAYTKISSIPVDFFKSSANTVTHITISHTLLNTFSFKSIQRYLKLQFLNLEHNKISSIPSDSFEDGLPQLQELNLKGNEIANIGSYAFSNMPLLYKLDLSENWLKSLEPNAFSMKNHKESLILLLEKNSISQIDAKSFDGLTFSSIHLEFNHLELLQQNIFEPFLEVMQKMDSSLFLKGNPISCNTSLSWLVEKSLPIKQHIRDLICPDGKLLETVSKGDLMKYEKMQN